MTVFPITPDHTRPADHHAAPRTGNRLLGAGLILLGTAVGAVAVLGPLVSGVLRYRSTPDEPESDHRRRRRHVRDPRLAQHPAGRATGYLYRPLFRRHLADLDLKR
ncbi:hypothetical protein [Actinoplanes derwentensis]|uniref:Uncharacterized protein n=1 Tax=Actinoplanes derwentensis TaxID=113562 RepID=A0A1H1UF73_9ACTN|nr:hypothetical protein [Actinoplanes derwentensis]GID85288.1 hypothetical protein Ade03nite_42120 [Actinoplanes derwentensis]SDS71137.1 hypothetical protein SAMN04489716_1421 [Actinoplanes derwentensis]